MAAPRAVNKMGGRQADCWMGNKFSFSFLFSYVAASHNSVSIPWSIIAILRTGGIEMSGTHDLLSSAGGGIRLVLIIFSVF